MPEIIPQKWEFELRPDVLKHVFTILTIDGLTRRLAHGVGAPYFSVE